MIARYRRREDLISKIEWEGDIYETVAYGVRHEDIDPELLPELRAAWKQLEGVYEEHLRPAIDRVDELLRD